MPTENHNAFISYAWVDNQPFVAGRTGWVSTFVDRLRKHLGRELGRKEQGDRVWLDYERLRGSDNVTNEIREKLRASRLLVPIVSNGYLASPWCRQELEIFLDLYGPDSGRIFPVWMSPTDEVPPAPLDALLKYKFWYEGEDRIARTRWFPDIDPPDRDYGDMQQDMARDMTVLLREIIKREQPDLQLPEPGQKPPCVIKGGHLILVNGGEADAEHVRCVAERLWEDHQVGSVVPLVAQKDKSGYKPSEITKDLRDNLGMCTTVLQLNCLGPDKQVYKHLVEYQKATTKLRKGKRPPSLLVCQGAAATLSIHPPGMQVLHVNGDCASDCLRALVSALAQ